MKNYTCYLVRRDATIMTLVYLVMLVFRAMI